MVNWESGYHLLSFIACTSPDKLNNKNRAFYDDKYLQMNNMTRNKNVTSQK